MSSAPFLAYSDSNIVTPRTAWDIYAGLDQMAIGERDIIGSGNEFQWLPTCAKMYESTYGGFYDQLRLELDDLLERFSEFKELLAPDFMKNMAQQVLLHCATGIAQVIREKNEAPYLLTCDLPEYTEPRSLGDDEDCMPTDYDWDYTAALLFDDLDHMMLYDKSIDGIESDEALLDRLGRPHLHPSQWLTPFYDN